MNIIDYSIRLGKALNKTQLGKEIKRAYNSLVEESKKDKELTINHYTVYNQCVEQECSRNHFYGWSNAFEIMKHIVESNPSDIDKFILDNAKYIINNDKYYDMAKLSAKMGNISVKLCDAVFLQKVLDKDVLELFEIMKVKNAFTDLKIAVERSGLHIHLIKNIINSKLDNNSESELRKRNYIPYMDDWNPLIKELGINSKDMDSLDRMMFVQYIILMGIFVGFWDLLKELSTKDIVEGELIQPQGIRKGNLKHICIVQELTMRESWIYKIQLETENYYFFANKRTLHIGKPSDLAELTGVAYPQEDIGLFERKDVLEVKI